MQPRHICKHPHNKAPQTRVSPESGSGVCPHIAVGSVRWQHPFFTFAVYGSTGCPSTGSGECLTHKDTCQHFQNTHSCASTVPMVSLGELPTRQNLKQAKKFLLMLEGTCRALEEDILSVWWLLAWLHSNICHLPGSSLWEIRNWKIKRIRGQSERLAVSVRWHNQQLEA